LNEGSGSMRRTITVLGLFLLTWPALAQTAAPNWMGDAEIKKAFSGVTIKGLYADGTAFTESYSADARISYTDVRATLTGRWSVVNGAFCTLYDSMITGGCFKVMRHSGNCFEFYFLAASESEAEREEPSRPSWTARGWDQSKPATCDEKPSA
jgi:hypothetical protein